MKLRISSERGTARPQHGADGVGAGGARLVAAAWTPLTFDEAYYWMWSKHLAGGYYDHPPAVAAGDPLWAP